MRRTKRNGSANCRGNKALPWLTRSDHCGSGGNGFRCSHRGLPVYGKAAMEDWENSPERRRLLCEVERYAIQTYAKSSGLETWFDLPNIHSVLLLQSGMTMVIFLAAGATGFVSHLFLGPYLGPGRSWLRPSSIPRYWCSP